MTSEKTISRIDAKIDMALLPGWKNTRMYEAEIIIPKGQQINIGKVAPQAIESTGTILKGGVDQIVLPIGLLILRVFLINSCCFYAYRFYSNNKRRFQYKRYRD